MRGGERGGEKEQDREQERETDLDFFLHGFVQQGSVPWQPCLKDPSLHCCIAESGDSPHDHVAHEPAKDKRASAAAAGCVCVCMCVCAQLAVCVCVYVCVCAAGCTLHSNAIILPCQRHHLLPLLPVLPHRQDLPHPPDPADPALSASAAVHALGRPLPAREASSSWLTSGETSRGGMI